MKKIIILLTLALLSYYSFAQTTGDFRSRQNGNWDDNNTWETYDGTQWVNASTGQIPSNTTTLTTVRANHTVSVNTSTAECGSMTIDANGRLQTATGTANQISVYGDLTNNGDLDFFSGTDATTLIFAGNGDASFSCGNNNTDIYEININKDIRSSTVTLTSSGNFSIQEQNSSTPRFLTLSTGTFHIAGTFTLSSQTFTGNNNITLSNTAGFWLDNPNYTVEGRSGNITTNGLIRISNGTFNVGPNQDNGFALDNDLAQFIMEGGTMNIQGFFHSGGGDTIVYNQSGGTINVALQQVTVGYRYCFRIDDPGAQFTVSGGTINIVNTNTADREYSVDSDAGNTNITGGTLNIGTAATSGDFSFEIRGQMPNVIIDNTNNIKTATVYGDTWINNDLTVNGILQYRDASDDIYIYGNTIINSGAIFQVNQAATANRTQILYLYGNLLVDGSLDGFHDNAGNEARLYAYFQSTSNATVTGTGALCEFYDLRVNKGTDMTPQLDIQRAITLDDGDANDGNRLYVQNGTLKFSGSETTNLIPYYNNQSLTSTTGKFWMANPNLTIGWANAGNATSNGEFVLDAGTFNSGANFTIQQTSTANNQINGGTLYAPGDFDMEQDVLITAGNINVTGSFYMDGNGDAETGDLTINGGTITIGDGDNVFQATGDTGDTGEGGSLTMSNGTVNVYGRVVFSNGTGTEVTSFTMTGGNINVDPQRSDVGGTNAAAGTVFSLPANTIVNFTGGTVTIIDPNVNNNDWYDEELYVQNNGIATKNFTGSTFIFGDGVSTTAGYPGHGFSFRTDDAPVDYGNIIINNPNAVTNDRIVHIYDQDISMQNLTLTDGYLDMNDRNTGTILTIYGDVVNNGEIQATDIDCQLIFAGTSAQNYSGTGFFTAQLDELTINNTSATGVTINADLGGTWVNLTDGHVYTSSTNYLTVYGTDPANLTGGSSASYVQGNLRRAIPNNASAADYNFPIGKTNYRLLEILGVTTSGTDTGFIAANVFEGVNMSGLTGGSGLANPTVAEDIYWQISPSMNTVSLDAVASIRLTYSDPSTTPPRTLAQSNNSINGAYNSIGRIAGSGTLQSESFDLSGINPSGDAYIIISEVEPLTGTYTVGASGDYLNLTEVAAELRQKYVDGNVYFELLADYDASTETIPIVFDKLMLTASSYSVTIRPQAGVSGTTTERDGNTANEALIFIDNVHNLTFDGRPGGTGSSDWVISNTLAANPGPVFEFENDANTDTLSYLTLQSDNSDLTSGVVVIGTTNQTNGNDNNVIRYCDITGYSANPLIGIYSVGTAGANNDGNKVDNCNIYDFFSATEDPKGIYLGANNTNWTISNNKFYQTASRIFSEDQTYFGIHIDNTSGNNFLIDGNTIGFAASDGSGVTTISGAASRFTGIWLNVGTGTASTAQNNIISGISFTSNYNSYNVNGVFSGIFIEDGSLNIGTSGNPNIIGSSSASDAISITHESGGYSYGIKSLSNDVLNISYNNIGGITSLGLANDDVLYFRGIYTNLGTLTISNNTIGSSSQTNSIKIGINGSTTANTHFYGIFNTTNATANISGNIIANVVTNGTGTGGITIGIYCDDALNTITGNQIYNLASYTRRAGTPYSPSIGGIRKTSTDAGQEISGNIIHSLSSEHTTTTADITITGIALSSNLSTQDVIKQNFVHSFNSSTTDLIYTGIHIETGTTSIHNNMIRLGINAAGNSVTQALRIYGITNNADSEADIYYNSVYIGGTGVTNQQDRNSYAFFNLQAQITNVKNNIFVNERSNSSGTDSKHYALFLTYKDNVITDYNIYNATGTGGILSGLDNNDFTSLQAHRAYFTNPQDIHSGVGDPNFANANGDASVVDLHLTGNTSAYQTGIIVASMAEDFDGTNRSGNNGDRTNIGADNGNYTITNAEDIFTPNLSYTPITNQTPLTDAVVDVTITDQAPAGQGVDQTNPPRIYFRRADSDTPANIENWDINRYYDGVLQSGDGENGVWRFTIEGNGGAFYNDLADNDIIEYFIVVQDLATTSPNVWYSKYDATTPDFTNVSTVVAWPGASVDVNFYGIGGNLKGLYTIGTSPADDFTTITGSKGFFQNLNALNVTGDIVAVVKEDITEPATYGCGQWTETGAGGYYVTISTGDATLKTLTTSAANHLIRLEGADRLIIDGSVNGSGKYLKFEQTNTDYSTITFSNDATYNQVKNAYIIGAPTLKPIGIVHFGEAVSSGNSNNTVSGNFIWNLSASMTDNAVYSRGNTDNSALNANNTISNNDIKNFAVTGVWVTSTGNGSGWTIANNTMYNDFATKPDREQSGIRIEQADGHTISGNWVGGNTATIPTASWENTGQNDFYGIYLNVGTSAATNVSNNTIHDIHLSNTAGSPNEFRGIYADAGLINITGNSFYNIITDGADYTRIIYLTGTSGISVSNNSVYNITKNGNGDFRTFYLDVTGATEPDLTANQFQNNTIKALTINSSNAGDDFYGVQIANGNFNISGNIIGGNTAADKITFGGGNDFRVFDIAGDDFNLGITNNRIENIEITGNDVFRALYINNSDDNIDISIQNNIIDNLSLNCSSEASMMYIADGRVILSSNTIGSAAYGINNTGTGVLTGLYLTPSDNDFIIENNTITNINNSADLRAVYVDENRPYQINNNTISNINTANDISVTGIQITAANNATIDGNTVENISMTGTAGSFSGIWVSAATVLSIGTNTANTIGSTSTANSISVAGTSLKGISLMGDAVVTAKNNVVANVSSTGTDATVSVKGIEIDGAGTKSVSANTVHDITTSSTKTDITDGVLASQGIWVGGTSSSSITGNTLYNISAGGTASVNVAGICENATNATFTKNLIYKITNTSSALTRTASGFVLNTLDAGYVANNFILLGANDDTEYSGIWLPADNAAVKNIYYNSIYIGGTATGGNSYALIRENNTTPLNVKNNIFANFRTGGSGAHYAIANRNTTSWASTYTDHNNYYAATAATTGLWGTTDTDFETWTNNTAGDTLSFDNQPQFIDAANYDLHIDAANSCAFNSIGTPIATVTDDYDGATRDATHPDIGAHEFSPTGGNANDIWRGWVSSDWDNAANWQCEQLPANTANLTIPDKLTNDPVIGRALPATEVTVNNLTIESGGLLTINPGNKLTLTGSLIVNGTLTLETPADNNASASLIDNGTISGSGNIRVRRYMSGGMYHYVSSPIQAGGNANSDLFTANPAGYFNANFYAFDETMDLDGNPATNPADPFQADSLKKSWYFAHNGDGATAVTMNITQGYATYDWANRTITFVGLTNTGTMDITGLSYTNNDPQSSASLPDFYDGWQLVGNPYPSTLDWDAVRAGGLTNMDDGIYVWDNNQYAAYVNGIATGSGTQDNRIAPMQGFFVHTTASNASITINNSHRTHGVPNFKTEIIHDNLVKLKVSANGFDDYMAVYFKNDATIGFDGKYELLRMFSYNGNVPHFYAFEQEASTKLMLDCLPDTLLNGNARIPLGIRTDNGGTHTITLEEFNAFNTTQVYLEDTELNKMINLRNFNSYVFEHPGGELNNRFYLVFNKNSAPIVQNPLSKQFADEDVLFKFTFSNNVFKDNDLGDSITYYAAKLTDGSELPEWLHFDSQTRLFSGTPDNDDVGVLSVQIIAYDILEGKGSTNFEIEVQNVNDPPYVQNTLSDIELNQNDNIAIQVPDNTFADIDINDELTLSAQLADGSTLPSWIKFDEANGTFSGTAKDVGEFDIKVIATDKAGESTSTKFRMTVLAVTGIVSIAETEVSIYPNPSEGKFYIVQGRKNASNNYELFIKDINGKIIYKDKFNKDKKFINLIGIAPGTYFLEIRDNKAKIIKPLIIR
jgi:hypothetical protein